MQTCLQDGTIVSSSDFNENNAPVLQQSLCVYWLPVCGDEWSQIHVLLVGVQVFATIHFKIKNSKKIIFHLCRKKWVDKFNQKKCIKVLKPINRN